MTWPTFKELLPLLQIIVERLFGWPVAVVILALVFRHSVGNLIARLTRLKASGIGADIDISTEASEQLEAKILPDDELAANLAPQLEIRMPEDVAKRRELLRNYGGDDDVVQRQMDAVKFDLNTLRFNPQELETYELLVRHLAVTQLLAKAENVYRLIFGSQIDALRALQMRGPQPISALVPMFTRAAARSPKFYGDYTFEQWLDFLKRNGLIVDEQNGSVSITFNGQEFLKFMASQKLPKKAH